MDVAAVTLDNILALGKTHPLDFFDLATEGTVAAAVGRPYYLNVSTTPIDTGTVAKYAADLERGTLQYALVPRGHKQKFNLGFDDSQER